MGPRHVLTGIVAVVVGVALLWCDWLVLRADLTTGTTVAAVLLWLLAAGAVVTIVAFIREVERHRADRRDTEGGRRRGAARPLPGLVLLWVAGLTALVPVSRASDQITVKTFVCPLLDTAFLRG